MRRSEVGSLNDMRMRRREEPCVSDGMRMRSCACGNLMVCTCAVAKRRVGLLAPRMRNRVCAASALWRRALNPPFSKMALKELLVPHLFPENCYDELFVRFNLLDSKAPSLPAPPVAKATLGQPEVRLSHPERVKGGRRLRRKFAGRHLGAWRKWFFSGF